MNLLLFFLFNLKASLLSTGGLGNVPSLNADLIQRGMATQKQFAAALAVGQLSPGPNGLWVVALGFALGGIAGALLSVLAICIPACLVLIIRGIYQKHEEHIGVVGFIWGLSIAMVVEFVGTMSSLIRAERNILVGCIAAAITCLLSLKTKVPVFAMIVVAAILGILLKP